MKLTSCKKASIYNLDNQFLCDAAVSKVSQNTCCLTLNPRDADSLRSEVIITFYDSVLGLVTCYCRLSDFKEYLDAPGKWKGSVICTAERELSVIQRRDDIKVATFIQTTLTFTNEENISTKVAAYIHDISAGGVFFTSFYTFRPGQICSFFFAPHQKRITLQAEILRVQEPSADQHKAWGRKTPDSPPLMGYGCRFVRLSPSAESQVRNFVFRQDVLIRQKKLLPPEMIRLT